MKSQSLILFASLAVNLGLGVYLVRRPASDAPTESVHSGLSARLQPLESQGRSVPSAYEQNEVRNTLTKHATATVQSCFREITAKDPSITKGTVQVDWQILPSGKTKSPEIVVSDLVAMNDCVVRAVGGLDFPQPPTDRPVYVSHKFVFRAELKPKP